MPTATLQGQLEIVVCIHSEQNMYSFFFSKICTLEDFPGGAMDRNPPAGAGGFGFNPWSGKIPHATEHVSPCTTTPEPTL